MLIRRKIWEGFFYFNIKFIDKYIPKLLNCLENIKNIPNPDENFFSLVLQSIELLYENCTNIMENHLESTANVKYSNRRL